MISNCSLIDLFEVLTWKETSAAEIYGPYYSLASLVDSWKDIFQGDDSILGFYAKMQKQDIKKKSINHNSIMVVVEIL